jgi:hypothetical protein
MTRAVIGGNRLSITWGSIKSTENTPLEERSPPIGKSVEFPSIRFYEKEVGKPPIVSVNIISAS